MTPYHSLPIQHRSALMNEYRKNGYSYHQAIADFNSTYNNLPTNSGPGQSGVFVQEPDATRVHTKEIIPVDSPEDFRARQIKYYQSKQAESQLIDPNKHNRSMQTKDDWKKDKALDKVKKVGDYLKLGSKLAVNSIAAFSPEPISKIAASAVASGMDMKDAYDAFESGNNASGYTNLAFATVPYLMPVAKFTSSNPKVAVSPRSFALQRSFTNNLPATRNTVNLLPQDYIKSIGSNLRAYSPEIKQGSEISGSGQDIYESGLLDNFKSEIDWGNWNKEIPDNTQLMKEYNNIERLSKANGTWMKNQDGSNFQGTPEQFVQQNSSNFKKAFGDSKLINKDGSPIIYHHGSPKKFDTFDESKFGTGNDDGFYGKGIYASPDKYVAKSYSIENMFDPNMKQGEIYSLYVNSKNPGFVYKGNEKVMPSSMYRDYNRGINNDIDKFNYDLLDIKKPGNHHEVVIPFKSNPKSAIGNNGMFDMTNPNIYKAMIPTGIGSYMYNQQK